MAITIQLLPDIEQKLRAQVTDLDAQAKEVLLVELYRRDKLSHYELAQALGLDRFETDALLKKHGVTEDLPTAQEYENDLERLREMTAQ